MVEDDHKASASWREVTKWLLTAVLFLAGTVIAWHMREVSQLKSDQSDDRRAIVDNQKAIVQIVEQLKFLTSNSTDAREWRSRVDMKIDALIEAEYGRTKPKMPKFGRDSQTFGSDNPH